MGYTGSLGAILSVVLIAGVAGAGAQVVGATLGGRVAGQNRREPAGFERDRAQR